jgi:hypothetical protein
VCFYVDLIATLMDQAYHTDKDNRKKEVPTPLAGDIKGT